MSKVQKSPRAPHNLSIPSGKMESTAVRRLKELIAANDSPTVIHSIAASHSSKFSLPSPSPYVQRFQPLLATPQTTAPLPSSHRPSPHLPTPPPHSTDTAQAAISGAKGSILNDFETTLLMLRMQRMELEAETRVRLLDPPSPTRQQSSSSQRSANSQGNSPHFPQHDSQPQHTAAASAADFHRLESCAARAELAARRVEECTSQCRLILQQARALPGRDTPTSLTLCPRLSLWQKSSSARTRMQSGRSKTRRALQQVFYRGLRFYFGVFMYLHWAPHAPALAPLDHCLMTLIPLQLTARPSEISCPKPRFIPPQRHP
jgi:hypothetical protein